MGRVRSHVGITTRCRHHANHAQNRFTVRPPIVGPWPQSHWAHMPGSTIQGRYTRRRPAPERRLHLRHRPAHGAVRAVVAEGLQLLVAHIGADRGRWSGRPTPRSWGGTHPAAALGEPARPDRPARPGHVSRPSRRPCSANTPPTRPPLGTTRSGRTLRESLSLACHPSRSSSRSGVIGFSTDNSTGRSTHPRWTPGQATDTTARF